MDTQQIRRRIPALRFRVLIIGRANAGKTSILQRVCETTESPFIYRGKEEVELDPSMDRGEHTIDDELVFSNHRGYVFHDSRGIESGSTEELEILQKFIRRKCGERLLGDRLHAIWYCVPMDNHRPELDLKFFKGICPDQNVPVIAVFTKHDQFLRNVGMHMLDYPGEYPKDSIVSQVAEEQFQKYYLRPLGENVRFVRLEKMHMKNRRCDDLIVETAATLNEDVTALMLLAVQRDNIGLSVKSALKRAYSFVGAGWEISRVVRECLVPFPYIWYLERFFFSLEYSLEYESEYEREEEYFSRSSSILSSLRERLSNFLKQVMSLPYIHNFTTTGFSDHHFVLAVVLILKHATFLRLETPSRESALTRAELEYREANIDSKIQQFLSASSEDYNVELFAGFIMATDIMPSLSSVSETDAQIKDHQLQRSSVSETHMHRNDRRFRAIWRQLFSRESDDLPKLENTTREDR